MEYCKKINDDPNKLHIAIFPWLAQGHLIPFLQVSTFLAQKGHRVSFISTPKNLRRLPKLIPQSLSHLITFVELPLPRVEGLPDGAESTSELPIDKVPFLKRAYDGLQPGLTRFLEESCHVINWVVHDFASHWLPRVASGLGVKLVFFCIFNATTMSFTGPPSEAVSGYRSRPEDFTVVPTWWGPDLPNGVAFKLYEITSHWDCMDLDVPDLQRFGMVVQGSQLVLTRTCPEFEADSLSLLRTLYQKPVLPIGLLPPSDLISRVGDGDADERWGVLKQWLDRNKGNSVVYIALGTELSLSQDMTHELAHGIEKSGLPFVWVVNDRPMVEGKLGSGIIPSGFETRVSGRGVIWRGWAPQLGILAHPSVGGFLTHCGWSSVIEGLGFGRALILFPGGSSDIGLVARLLHSKGIGLEIPRDDKNGSFSRDSVAESIRRVMVDKEGEPLREKARAMREIFGNVELQNKYLNEFAEFLVRESSSSTESSQ
ncbi:UDP-glucuronosyl/UDP-glucosyltransferase [Trema orientale]|uniref:UDP-glucuronosyl/UDP-glucosyltransferase n=1 Tax=Trema orientale TaxID=63057 RepID=A0A2P5EG03_TREOI|nr:UDP-glucuronosyl/UDP-glucosyltransferase [Trema orientale]